MDCRLVHQGGKLAQLGLELGQGALGELHLDIGLHLPDDAAHVLAPADAAAVGAQIYLPAAAAGDAAHVIAHVFIAHGGLVGAVEDVAGGVPCHAAHIGGGIGRPRPGKAAEIQGEIHIHSAEIQRLVGALDVHIGTVLAGDHPALVITGDAAHHAVAKDGAPALGGTNHSAGAVFPGDAPHLAGAGHRPAEGAIHDPSIVFTHDAAHGLAVPLGSHRALDGEGVDLAAGLEDGEQPRRSNTFPDLQSGDGVALPLKGSAKGGDGRKFCAAQVDIPVQDDGLAPGPGVQGAGLGQLDEILCRRDVDAPRLLSPDGDAGEEEQHRRHGGQDAGQHPAGSAVILLHGEQPPFPLPLPRRTGW